MSEIILQEKENILEDCNKYIVGSLERESKSHDHLNKMFPIMLTDTEIKEGRRRCYRPL